MTYEEFQKIVEEMKALNKKYDDAYDEMFEKARKIGLRWNDIFEYFNENFEVNIDLYNGSNIEIRYFIKEHGMGYFEDQIKKVYYDFPEKNISTYQREKYCLWIPIQDIFDEEKIINQWLKDKKELERKENEQEILERERLIDEQIKKKEERKKLYDELRKEFEEKK